MRKLWDSISELGIKEVLPEVEMQSIVFTNRINIILLLCVLSSLSINLFLGDYLVVPALVVALFPLILTFYFQYKNYYLAARINIITTCLAVLIFILYTTGTGGGIEFYFLTLTILPAVIFSQKRLIIFFQALCIFSLIALKVYEENVAPITDKTAPAYYIFYIVNAVYSGLLIIIAIAFFKNRHINSLRVLRESFLQIEEQNRKLEITNKNLERSNSDLEQFAYVASHDLKEPLRMISSYATLLTRKAMPDDADAQVFSHFISEGVDRMQNLINDLLSFSRIGNDRSVFVKTDLNNIFMDVKKQLSLIIDETDAVVQCSDLPVITAIPSQISQVFYNLIGNALKFRKSNAVPHISVEARAGEKYWLFLVRDNGIGIASQYRERIFDIFQRLHGHDKYQGTGIGLALCKRIVELHGGNIWLESEPEKGSTFYFTISMDIKPNEGVKQSFIPKEKNIIDL